jgi:hypothetical protein
MIHLDSYGTSLAFDAATPEGLGEWDRLESELRSSSTPLPPRSKPLLINAVAPLKLRAGRNRLICKTVVIHSDLKRLTAELQHQISQLGS